MSISPRGVVDRTIYDRLKRRYRLRNKLEQLALWLIAALFFVLFLYFGAIQGEEETLQMSSFAEKFWKEAGRSAALILPSLLVTVLMAVSIGLSSKLITIGYLYTTRLNKNLSDNAQKIALLARGSFWILSRLIALLPSFLSAIPPFISGIFLIRYANLDTMNSYNFFYGTLCLAAFNLNYFYQRSTQKLAAAYTNPSVLFARSLGLKESEIFRRYVFPRVVRDNLAILRELLPHIVVESIIVEYTFTYNGLLRSAIQTLLSYQSQVAQNPIWESDIDKWYYLAYIAIVFYAFVLFITFFAYIFRCLEEFFSPLE